MNKILARITLMSLLGGIATSANADPAPDFTLLVEKTSPSVVSVEVRASANHQVIQQRNVLPPGFPDIFEEFFGVPRMQLQPQSQGQTVQGEGSGFIIDKDGYILTNAHVVRDAQEVIVRLHDQKEVKAKILGADTQTDIALLKVEEKNLPSATLGDSDQVKVGDWVLAIGSPFGFEETATKGIVSAIGRSLPNGTYTPFIQTDAAINPGNSGGPLFNSKGEVIGINSQIYTRSGAFNGLGFAIPINVAKNIAEQLKKGDKITRGWLGVVVQGVNQQLAESFGMSKPEGALINDVQKDSPAQKAGLKVGDVIISFDGKRIAKSPDLPPLVAITPIDKVVKIVILREGKEQTIEVKIANQDQSKAVSGASTVMLDNFGMEVQSLDDNVRKQLNYEGDKGVVITQVRSNSLAARAGLQRGDVLIAIANQPITKPDEARRILEQLPKKRPAPFLIYRNGQTIFFPVQIAE